MYTIKIGGKTVYNLNLSTAGYVVISPRLALETNRAGTLEFLIPDSNPSYADCKTLSRGVKVYDDGVRIFNGWITNTNRNFYRQKLVHCEGDLAWLNDVAVRPYSYSNVTVRAYLEAMIAQYNSAVSASMQMQVGIVDVTGNISRANNTYATIWDEIEDKLIDKLGGFVMTRCAVENGNEVTYIDYRAQNAGNGSQKIRFGQNLIDLEDYIDAEETYNTLVPLGALVDSQTGERLTIKSVNNNKDYLQNTVHSGQNGVIERVKIWDDITVAANLKSAGQADLDTATAQSQSITISAVDLHLLDVNTDAFTLGKAYEVISHPHDMSGTYYPLVKINLPLSNPEQAVYTFGKTKPTLTGG